MAGQLQFVSFTTSGMAAARRGRAGAVVRAAALVCMHVAVAACAASGGRRGRAEAAEAEAAGSAIPAEGRGQRPRTDAAEGSAAQTSATGLSHQPLEKLQRRGVRRYLESQGVGVQDIPKAMLVYEGISMGIL